jgi:pantothenate kinase
MSASAQSYANASAIANNLTRNGCTLFMTLIATGGGEVRFYRSLLTAEL